ncbi:hypothetical protein Bca4012_030788 [Brassica carinata]
MIRHLSRHPSPSRIKEKKELRPLDGVGVVAQIIQAVQVQAGARDGVGALAGTARDGVGALAGTAQDGVGVRAPTIQVVQVQSPVRDGVGVGNTNSSGSGSSGSGWGWGGHSEEVYNATYNEPRKIIVGGDKEWTYGFNYSDWASKTAPFFVNDILVFKYNPPAPFTHTVYLFSNPSSYEKCDVKKGNMIASPKQGAGNGFELVLYKNEALLYFMWRA